MPFEVALVVAGVILVASTIGMIVFVASRQQQAKEEELKRAASTRGWQFESKLERGYRVHRYTGSSDGVSWVAESLEKAAGNKSHERHRHIARWHGNWSPGITGAILVMGLPRGKEELGKTIAAGEGFFAKLAQKAVGFALDKAVDVYFGDGPGKEVDAQTMHRMDGSKIPGFVVMAADKDEGARILSQGLESALIAAASDKGSVLGGEDRPWILFRPHAISLARMERFRDVNEIDAFASAGLALTRTSKFGRPFA